MLIKKKRRKRRKRKKGKFISFNKWKVKQEKELKKKRKKEKETFKNNITKGINDEEDPENEYELQSYYHSWYRRKYPLAPSNGCPYICMRNPATRTKVLRKGYLTGLPDYVEYDPRIFIGESKNEIKIKVIPGKFIEFKTPKGTGRVRPCQKKVCAALKRRGYMVLTSDDLGESRSSTIKYRKGVPLYNGIITINKKTHKVTFPRAPRKIKLPIPVIRKTSKMKKRAPRKKRRKKRKGSSKKKIIKK